MTEKNICFFNSAKTWGGGEKWHYEAALDMQQSGYEVLFITSPGSELEKKLSGKIKTVLVKVSNLSFLNPFKIMRLKKILLKNKINTIVINLSADLKLAGLAANYARIPRIIYRRGSALAIKNSFLNRYYFQKILTDVLANSKATKRTILQNNSALFPAEKIKVIYNPIYIKEFLEKDFQPVYKKQGGEIVICCLGRLAPEKNHQFLIDLAVRLHSVSLPFKILIGGSGALENDLKASAINRKVADKVIFLGFIDNVKDLLSCCDIFILPSLWEGFGYVLAEASLCQKPVLAFDNGSAPELVSDGITGFLIPENDIHYTVEKIQLLYDQPELAKKMGENGRNFVMENFEANKINNQFLHYINGNQ